MSESSILEKEKFWDILRFLLRLEVATDFSTIKQELNIQDWELVSYVNFLSDLGYGHRVSSNEKGKFFHPSPEPIQFSMNFSFLEWIEFQAHFPKLSEYEDKPFHQELKEKLINLESQYYKHDIYGPLQTLENILSCHKLEEVKENKLQHKEVLFILEEAILDTQVVNLSFEEHNLILLPQKIIFFEGSLHVIGEDVLDKSLVNISINHIHSAKFDSYDYTSDYSRFELDEFVYRIKSMGENQIRLVLKISRQQKFSLNFDDKYFHSPCLFTNPAGDFIWAATIEPCNEVFEWLCELGPAVEILDPTNFKIEFIKYCEHKLKKLA